VKAACALHQRTLLFEKSTSSVKISLKNVIGKVVPSHTVMTYGGLECSSIAARWKSVVNFMLQLLYPGGEKPCIGGRTFCIWSCVLKFIAQLYFCTTINVGVFCDMALCSPVEIYWPTVLITRLVRCALRCVLSHIYSLHDNKI